MFGEQKQFLYYDFSFQIRFPAMSSTRIYGCFLILSGLLLPVWSQGQSSLSGSIKSAGGETIPLYDITVHREGPSDLFSHSDAEIHLESEKYYIVFPEPGLYRVQVRAVFHYTVTVPVLVTDQPDMEMHLSILPRAYNDGTWFDEPGYLDWTRIKGNFNDYNYHTGIKMELREDGGISAYVPVTSDTLRYQVRGVSSGASPLPGADEYRLRDDGSFESLKYRDLPSDSVEIRYHPEEVDFVRHKPDSLQDYEIRQLGYIYFPDPDDGLWIEPLLYGMHMAPRLINRNPEGARSVSPETMIAHQSQSTHRNNPEQLERMLNELAAGAKRQDIHREQRALLLLAYASQLYRKHTMLRFMNRDREEAEKMELFYDPEILGMLPEYVSPAHPGWNRRSQVPSFLAELAGDDERVRDYLMQLVRHHPDDMVVRDAALALIHQDAERFKSVEEMPVYDLILERYGQRQLAWIAKREFESQSADR
jgi:hypothetical protein